MSRSMATPIPASKFMKRPPRAAKIRSDLQRQPKVPGRSSAERASVRRPGRESSPSSTRGGPWPASPALRVLLRRCRRFTASHQATSIRSHQAQRNPDPLAISREEDSPEEGSAAQRQSPARPPIPRPASARPTAWGLSVIWSHTTRHPHRRHRLLLHPRRRLHLLLHHRHCLLPHRRHRLFPHRRHRLPPHRRHRLRLRHLLVLRLFRRRVPHRRHRGQVTTQLAPCVRPNATG
jgi:hypothetical protein